MADFSEAMATELKLQKTLTLTRKSHEQRRHNETLADSATTINADGDDDFPTTLESGIEGLVLEGAEDPYNWGVPRKAAITAALCLNTIAVTMGSSVFTPGLFEMQAYYGTSSVVTTLAMSLYVLGMAFGPMIFAPMSEVYGRWIVQAPAWVAFCAFQAGAASSKNIQTLLVCRFFAGVFGSPTLTVAGGTMTDIYIPNHLGPAMGLFTMNAFLGPVIGPIAGGYFVQKLAPSIGWRWCFWFDLIFSGVLAINFLWMPETYRPVLLERKRLSIPEETRPKAHAGAEPSLQMFRDSVTRPIMMLFLDPVVFLASLYVSFVFSIVYLFFAAYPIVFRGRYHLKSGDAGLAFLGIGLGVFLMLPSAGYANTLYIRLKSARPIPNAATLPYPQGRLLMAIFGAFLPPISLFWFAWTGVGPRIHWIVPILSGIPFGLGLTCVFIGLITYIAEAYYEYSASAIAANTLMRSVMAAAFPLFAKTMYTNIKPEIASSILGAVAVVFVPVPWLFWKYGETLRGYGGFEKWAAKRQPVEEKGEKE